MLTRLQSSHYLPDLKVAITYCTFLLLPTILFFNLNLLHGLDDLYWKPLTDVSYFFLQLEQLLISHLVRIDIMFVLSVEPHGQEQFVKILCFCLVDMLDMLTLLLVLVFKRLYFLCDLLNGLSDFVFFCDNLLFFLLKKIFLIFQL